MARCPFANWRPLPENDTQPAIVPTQYIVHSAVDHPGPTYLDGYFDNPGVGVESHFWIHLDGTLDQYIDTEVRADANSAANRRPDGTGAVSVETEDEGDPDRRPWTPAQLDTLVRLGRWLVETHGIPASRCEVPDGPGIGWHAMWGAPSPWTSVRGKTCPGRARVPQMAGVIARIAEEPVRSYDQAVVVPTADFGGRPRDWDRAVGAVLAGVYDLGLVETEDGRRFVSLTHPGEEATIGSWAGVVGGATRYDVDANPPGTRLAVRDGDRWSTATAVADFIKAHPLDGWARRGVPQ